MGNCRSSESSVTAKLVLIDGHLKEFSWPVKVSLLAHENSDAFICSAEEMDFGEFAAAMGDDEVLQPGELYFELPSGWRNRRLQAEDMAELASKAGVALANMSSDNGRIVSYCCCGSQKVEGDILFPEKERPLLAAEGGAACAGSGGGGGAKGGKFVARLSAIVEEW